METESNLKHLLVDILTSVNCKAHRLTDNTINYVIFTSDAKYTTFQPSFNMPKLPKGPWFLELLTHSNLQYTHHSLVVYRVADYRANQQISLLNASLLSLSSCFSLGQFAVPHMPILNLFESQTLLIWVPNISSPSDHSF